MSEILISRDTDYPKFLDKKYRKVKKELSRQTSETDWETEGRLPSESAKLEALPMYPDPKNVNWDCSYLKQKSKSMGLFICLNPTLIDEANRRIQLYPILGCPEVCTYSSKSESVSRDGEVTLRRKVDISHERRTD